MTTNKNDPVDPEGDDTGVLADAGSADTTSIPMLSGATGHVSVELHTDDDDDYEGDVVDDTIAVSFDSLVTGQPVAFEPAAAVTVDDIEPEPEVEPEVEVIARRSSGLDAPHESLTTDHVFVIELPAEAEFAAEQIVSVDTGITVVAEVEPAEDAEGVDDGEAADDVDDSPAVATASVYADELSDDTSEIAEIVADEDEADSDDEIDVAPAADVESAADVELEAEAELEHDEADAHEAEADEAGGDADESVEPTESAADADVAPVAHAEPAEADAAVEAEPEASTDSASVIDTATPATHDEGVTEQIPEPQRAVAARSSHDLERVMTRHDVNVMAAKRLDDLSSADRETSDLLTADRLLDPHQVVRPEPEGPWRQFLYSISGHRINLGDSKKARARKALDVRISASLPGGARFVPVVSRKGGVGKTTITTLLGMALADARDDRVIAVDANPDRGTLSERIERPSGKTVRDLVRGRDRVQGYNDVSTIVARDETRLDVLASDTDPMVSEAFSDDDYRHVAEIAAHYYSIVLTDTGTGIVHSVMGATLELADQIVVVAGLSVDEARLASETLTWLESNGYENLVRNSIVVLNNARPGSPLVRQDEVEAHFRTRVRDVVRVPYDPQIAAGSAIHFRELQPETRLAARTLAAKVVEGLRALSIAA